MKRNKMHKVKPTRKPGLTEENDGSTAEILS